jgi:hypothetical protein
VNKYECIHSLLVFDCHLGHLPDRGRECCGKEWEKELERKNASSERKADREGIWSERKTAEKERKAGGGRYIMDVTILQILGLFSIFSSLRSFVLRRR